MLLFKSIRVSTWTRFSRQISFFGKKKPSDDDCPPFKVSGCGKEKPSSLTIKESHLLESCCFIPKVVIVGAGLAGLTAASRLLSAGVKDLVILEATNRTGGRIMSAWVGDGIIELGPTVLSGASIANPLYNLANMSGAITYPIKRLPKKPRYFLTSDGRAITNSSIESLIVQQLLSDVRAPKRAKPPSASCNPQQNLMQYLGLRIQQELLYIPSDLQLNAGITMWGMINSLRHNFGADLSYVSVDALADRAHTPGGSVLMEGGMQRIVAPMLREIPPGKLLLNTPVHRIIPHSDPQPNKAVCIIACDGKVFEADYVIVTIPMGVLKRMGNEMFEGALTPEQLEAIDMIKIGVKNHVYLEYAHPWWIPGIADMSLAWDMDELNSTNEWTKGITVVREVSGSKHLLAIELAGSEAQMIESVSDEEIAVLSTRFLRKYTGDSTIPFPTNIIVTKWTCDPYFSGSTVYLGVNTTPGVFKDLGGSPCDSYLGPAVGPIILSGDGTIPHYYGTMEGARRSGIKAANKIIRSTRIRCEEAEKMEEEIEETKREQQC